MGEGPHLLLRQLSWLSNIRVYVYVRPVLPMPLLSLSTRVVPLLVELDVLGVWSPTIVEVDDERLNVFASGARCVSLSSCGHVSR